MQFWLVVEFTIVNPWGFTLVNTCGMYALSLSSDRISLKLKLSSIPKFSKFWTYFEKLVSINSAIRLRSIWHQFRVEFLETVQNRPKSNSEPRAIGSSAPGAQWVPHKNLNFTYVIEQSDTVLWDVEFPKSGEIWRSSGQMTGIVNSKNTKIYIIYL